MEQNLVRENERVDDLQINGLKIIQEPNGFCFGIDAVLLVNFTKVKKNAKVVDLGTGTGIIPILLAGKTKLEKAYGIEIQEEVADMANRSVLLNNLQDRVEIINADLKEIDTILKPNMFNVITSNPPYMDGKDIINENTKKAISRHEVKCDLNDVMRVASRLLMNGGSFFMVHRPSRLADIICLARQYNLEPKYLRFVHSRASKAPNLILIQFTKGGRPELKIMNPLYIYEEDGSYTSEIQAIYDARKLEEE